MNLTFSGGGALASGRTETGVSVSLLTQVYRMVPSKASSG